MSDFLDYAVKVVDRVGQKMPDSFSADALIAWADSIGPDVLQDLTAWQPKRATVVVMPKRRRRAKR